MSTYSSDYTHEGHATADASAQREGAIARKIERRTARIPSDVFLWAAGATVLASLAIEVIGIARGERRSLIRGMRSSTMSAPLAGFVGMWVPSLLILGVYNKIVKVAGSDRSELW